MYQHYHWLIKLSYCYLIQFKSVRFPIIQPPLVFQFQESKNMSALDKAKLDCLSAFALNSLVWMWLRTKGENPKESEVSLSL